VGDDPTGREHEDAIDVVYAARLRDGVAAPVTARKLPRGAVSDAVTRRKRTKEAEPTRERDKVHPVLRELLATRDHSERHEMVVVAAERVAVPRFPEPAVEEPRSSATNRRLLRRSEALIRELAKARAEESTRLERVVQIAHGKLVEVDGAVELWIGRLEPDPLG
jgi:hypothetical protein